ncbi:MAG: hypothetical protein KKF33_19005 [Alphaproteobacteria bacterium]|nr:hypothetical protein [Alphaproteobacteria bacterium]
MYFLSWRGPSAAGFTELPAAKGNFERCQLTEPHPSVYSFFRWQWILPGIKPNRFQGES